MLDRGRAAEVVALLKDKTRVDALLLPVDALLQELPQVRLEPAQQAQFLRGQAVPWNGGPEARLRVYGSNGALLGVAERGGGFGQGHESSPGGGGVGATSDCTAATPTGPSRS